MALSWREASAVCKVFSALHWNPGGVRFLLKLEVPETRNLHLFASSVLLKNQPVHCKENALSEKSLVTFLQTYQQCLHLVVYVKRCPSEISDWKVSAVVGMGTP